MFYQASAVADATTLCAPVPGALQELYLNVVAGTLADLKQPALLKGRKPIGFSAFSVMVLSRWDRPGQSARLRIPHAGAGRC